MSIKAVIWDMGGVLLQMGDEKPRQELAIEFGLSLKQIYWAIFDSPSAQAATTGEITVMEHWRNVGSILNIPQDQLPGFLRRFWGVDNIDYPLINFIRCMHKYLKMGLLSNAWDNLHELIKEEWRVADAFDEIVISAEVGIAKPDLRIYQLAVERLSITPGEAVFIDDVLENVEAARQLGLYGVQFRTRPQALSELEYLMTSINGALPEDLVVLFQSISQNLEPFRLNPAQLIRCQVGLEYQINPDGKLVPFPGSSEQACYLVHRHSTGYLYFFHYQLPDNIISNLERIGPQKAFEAQDGILKFSGENKGYTRSGPFLAYTFTRLPAPEEFSDVLESNGRFEILIDQQPVCWAWSVRENKNCAEVAVETLPEHRQRGYARQAVAAWANAILRQGRTPFYSHAETNRASAALARSLELVHFSTCVSFE